MSLARRHCNPTPPASQPPSQPVRLAPPYHGCTQSTHAHPTAHRPGDAPPCAAGRAAGQGSARRNPTHSTHTRPSAALAPAQPHQAGYCHPPANCNTWHWSPASCHQPPQAGTCRVRCRARAADGGVTCVSGCNSRAAHGTGRHPFNIDHEWPVPGLISSSDDRFARHRWPSARSATSVSTRTMRDTYHPASIVFALTVSLSGLTRSYGSHQRRGQRRTGVATRPRRRPRARFAGRLTRISSTMRSGSRSGHAQWAAAAAARPGSAGACSWMRPRGAAVLCTPTAARPPPPQHRRAQPGITPGQALRQRPTPQLVCSRRRRRRRLHRRDRSTRGGRGAPTTLRWRHGCAGSCRWEGERRPMAHAAVRCHTACRGPRRLQPR